MKQHVRGNVADVTVWLQRYGPTCELVTIILLNRVMIVRTAGGTASGARAGGFPVEFADERRWVSPPCPLRSERSKSASCHSRLLGGARICSVRAPLKAASNARADTNSYSEHPNMGSYRLSSPFVSSPHECRHNRRGTPDSGRGTSDGTSSPALSDAVWATPQSVAATPNCRSIPAGAGLADSNEVSIDTRRLCRKTCRTCSIWPPPCEWASADGER